MGGVVIFGLSLAGMYGIAVLSDWVAERWHRRIDRREFDGGFCHDNEPVRITRIRAPFIVGERE